MTEDKTSEIRSVSKITTPHASRYLQQICKHFSHKRPVTFDEHQGSIEFPSGQSQFSADAGELTIHLTSPDEADAARLEDVVARHLLRFAFREDLQIEWRRL
jgi:uncharacterized protein